MGWEVVAANQTEGRIEATDTTFVYGFKDDIVIRITERDPKNPGLISDPFHASAAAMSA